MTPEQFANQVGRARLAERLGVGLTAVSNHVVRGVFPGSWFFVAKELAAEVGADCPDAMFRQQRPEKSKRSPSRRPAKVARGA